MPKPVARIGDIGIGICKCHDNIRMTGKIIKGDNTRVDLNSPVARIGDTVLADCGHTGVIVTGNFKHVDANSPIARVGDRFEGCFTGVIITGDNKHVDGE